MLKRGFTLAEVLITLMIIGVVATLTTPALVKNVGSSKIGPQLSKFVNTWETAAETMMMEESTSVIRTGSSYSYDANFVERLSKYMIMTNLKDTNNTNTITFKTASGADIGYVSVKLNSGKAWQLKDGTLLYIEVETRPAGWFYYPSGPYKGLPTPIFVDIGGLKGAHRIGKEVFCFLADSSGVLVPFGSNAHKNLLPDFNFSQCSLSANNYEASLACTGAIADNGYKSPW